MQAFADRGTDTVFASTMAVNTGSRRVLEKLGLTHTSSWVDEGKVAIAGSQLGEVGYELPRVEWAAKTFGESFPRLPGSAGFGV